MILIDFGDPPDLRKPSFVYGKTHTNRWQQNPGAAPAQPATSLPHHAEQWKAQECAPFYEIAKLLSKSNNYSYKYYKPYLLELCSPT